jgi:hypothetical protein
MLGGGMMDPFRMMGSNMWGGSMMPYGGGGGFSEMGFPDMGRLG